MKNIKFLFVSFTLVLFCLSAIHAQNAVLSGSFQFTNDINKRIGIIVLQSGLQKFEFPISDNIIIANLLPGRYLLSVEFQSGGRGGQMTKLSQNIDIESERRTVCRMNASAVLVFTKEYDRNSIALFAGNMRDEWRDYNNFNKKGNNTVVVVPPPIPEPMPISDADFSNLYNSVRNEKFADTKMRTLKTASNFNSFFTCDQVKRLALLFNMEDDKLECAKYLVPKVLDVQNLPYIKDIFTFDSTKNEYLKFLNRK
ncbi:MAG: DUF4476 domain-containing protein [Paludibacter sp.]|nr:DUF4476 domain-containing protein [Paludibacter sp.]